MGRESACAPNRLTIRTTTPQPIINCSTGGLPWEASATTPSTRIIAPQSVSMPASASITLSKRLIAVEPRRIQALSSTSGSGAGAAGFALACTATPPADLGAATAGATAVAPRVGSASAPAPAPEFAATARCLPLEDSSATADCFPVPTAGCFPVRPAPTAGCLPLLSEGATAVCCAVHELLAAGDCAPRPPRFPPAAGDLTFVRFPAGGNKRA